MEARRKGYTLMELMAVIAILIAVAAISIPLIRPMLADGNGEAAVDVIRARLTHARTKAMNSGRPYSFEYKADSGAYRCKVDAEEDLGDVEEDGLAAIDGKETTLPGDVKFPKERDSNTQSTDKDWVKLATFLPDGTVKQSKTSNGEVRDEVRIPLTNGQSIITVKLHCSTGVVSVGEGSSR